MKFIAAKQFKHCVAQVQVAMAQRHDFAFDRDDKRPVHLSNSTMLD